MLSANEIPHPLHDFLKSDNLISELKCPQYLIFVLCGDSLLSPHYQDDDFRRQAIGDPENQVAQFNVLVKIRAHPPEELEEDG